MVASPLVLSAPRRQPGVGFTLRHATFAGAGSNGPLPGWVGVAVLGGTFGSAAGPWSVATVSGMDQGDRALTDSKYDALCEALDDEYKAIATYEQVIADFGEIRPFANIVQAERRHAKALLALFERYRVAVPSNPWPGRVPRFSSVHHACVAGVEGEVENGAMYARLILATGRRDLIEVFEQLRDASQDRHLAAFERCVDRHRGAESGSTDEGRGDGRGRGHRRRHRGGPS